MDRCLVNLVFRLDRKAQHPDKRKQNNDSSQSQQHIDENSEQVLAALGFIENHSESSDR